MVRCSLLAGLRRKRRSLAAVLTYALLLNVLLAATCNLQAVAAALDPLAVAATCDSTGSSGDPVRHNSQHQPDCTLCSPACPMAGMAPGLEGAAAAVTPGPSSFALDARAQPRSSVTPPSIYRSDTAAQAPPSIG